MIAQDPDCLGSTFVSIVLGSDKTTVSVATAQNDYYPLYLSIRNICNGICCAHCNGIVLIGFLAMPKSTCYSLLLINSQWSTLNAWYSHKRTCRQGELSEFLAATVSHLPWSDTQDIQTGYAQAWSYCVQGWPLPVCHLWSIHHRLWRTSTSGVYSAQLVPTVRTQFMTRL